MEFIVDIVILAIVIISAIIGYRTGIIRTVFGCLAVVGALACAFFFAPRVGDFIKDTSVYEKMSARVVEIIDGYLDGGTENIESQLNEFADSPSSGTLLRLGFDFEAEAGAYIEKLDEAGNNYAVSITDTVLSFLATMLGALVVFVLSLILIKLLGVLLEKIFRLPVLKTVNRAGGLIVGAVLGIVIAYIFCMALEIVLPYIPENPVVYMGMAEKTYLYRYFVSFNPAALIIAGIGMAR